ncbi:MAG: aldehyde dehydrogenase [Thermoplasmata archaeon]|nr:MAG: aldehyde dehydrogenase [Thermoplasmata archaeon]
MNRQSIPVRPQPSSMESMDKALSELDSHKQEWVDLSIDKRIALLEQVKRDFPKVWDRWTRWSVAAKGVAERKLGNDMEWLELAVIARIHHVVHRSLCDIRDHGKPRIPGPVKMRSDGRVSVQVYPDYRLHGMLFRRTTSEVWMEQGLKIDEVLSKQASAYNERNRMGRVALVLGAGNASSLPPSDTFYKLINDLRVVALKMNPINSYLGPLLEEAYRSLIEKGYLRILYGGVVEGSYLVRHPIVEECHMTGSDRTYDAILFGTGDEGAQRKKRRERLVTKSFTGELGCITPWVVVPGPWKTKDVKMAAERMAFWMVRHEGYLCFAPRVLVLQRGWEHRRTFLDVLAGALEKVEPIRAYYSGSAELQKTFVTHHPEAREIGADDKDHVPWTIIEGVDHRTTNDICFRRESFSGLCAETSIPAKNPTEFLDKAVKFLNGTVWGNLSVTLVANKKILNDPEIGLAVEKAIADLRYGTVGINGPGTWGFYTMIAPWGAYPRNEVFDIQSGIGKVANFLLLPKVEKTVMRAPLETKPYPFRVDAKNLDVFSGKLTHFEANPSFGRHLGLVFTALRM